MVIVWCSNGILLASSFHTALFSLVTALVIYSAKDLVCSASEHAQCPCFTWLV